jgi:hypothetical protein
MTELRYKLDWCTTLKRMLANTMQRLFPDKKTVTIKSILLSTIKIVVGTGSTITFLLFIVSAPAVINLALNNPQRLNELGERCALQINEITQNIRTGNFINGTIRGLPDLR